MNYDNYVTGKQCESILKMKDVSDISPLRAVINSFHVYLKDMQETIYNLDNLNIDLSGSSPMSQPVPKDSGNKEETSRDNLIAQFQSLVGILELTNKQLAEEVKYLRLHI